MDRISRRTVGWLVGAAVILVAVGVVIGVLLTGDDTPERPEARTSPPPSLPPLEQACVDAGAQLQVQVYFVESESDDHMRRAAEALRDDDRIAELTTQTQAEAFAEFKVIFKDQPEMIEIARVETMPASVSALPADGVSRTDLAAAIEDELTGVDEVEAAACGEPTTTPTPSR